MVVEQQYTTPSSTNSNEYVCYITLFRSITMFCGIDSIMWNIFHIQFEYEEYSIEYCQSHITLLWIWTMLCIFITKSQMIWIQEVLQRKRANSQLLANVLDFAISTWKWAQRVQIYQLISPLPYEFRQLDGIFFSFIHIPKCLKWGQICILVVDVYSLPSFFPFMFHCHSSRSFFPKCSRLKNVDIHSLIYFYLSKEYPVWSTLTTA